MELTECLEGTRESDFTHQVTDKLENKSSQALHKDQQKTKIMYMTFSSVVLPLGWQKEDVTRVTYFEPIPWSIIFYSFTLRPVCESYPKNVFPDDS